MRNPHVSALLGLIVAVGGAVILVGWVAGIEEFIHPGNGLARVKPITALCFLIAGVQMLLTAYRRSKRNYAVVIAGAALFQLVVMGSQLLAALGISPTAIELTIHAPTADPDFHTNFRAGSIGTILILLGVAAIGLLDITGGRILLRRIVGKLTLTLPVLALVGYAAGVPALYFDLPGISAKMAIYSAVLGFFAGLSMYFSSPAFARTSDDPTNDKNEKE